MMMSLCLGRTGTGGASGLASSTADLEGDRAGAHCIR